MAMHCRSPTDINMELKNITREISIRELALCSIAMDQTINTYRPRITSKIDGGTIHGCSSYCYANSSNPVQIIKQI